MIYDICLSKIGKKPIKVPDGVNVKIEDGFISVKASKGELKKFIPPEIDIKFENSEILLKPKNSDGKTKAIWGLTRALIENMIKGVNDGFEKILEFQGVGYKANVKGQDLEMGLGFSHPITVKAPEGITFKTEKNTIKVIGIDKELIGKIAAEIRRIREPEPYKGSGIRYQGEFIKKKAGKKAVTTA